MIYKLDFFYLLAVAVGGLVLLKAANAATNLYAFNCLGAESVVLRNKRIELASKKSEFAEIGMKAALAAATYPKFDRFCDGTIEAEDIARAFAHVDGVSWEQAYMIAYNILNDADTEPSVDGEVPGLNYVEFMTCLEGDAINFEAFLKDTRAMYDEHMAKDEARDLAKGKKKPAAKKEKSAKEKMKEAKAEEKRKTTERKKKLAEAEEKLKALAKAKNMDYDDFLKEKEDEDDDAMRARCKEAFESEKAEIEKHKPPEDPNKKKKGKAAEPAAAEAAADGGGGGGAASDPVPGAPFDGDKEERLGKCGKLTVKLTKASGLKAADKGGTSDPYVEAKLGKKSKKSKAMTKTCDPEWGDEELKLETKLSLKKCIKDGLMLVIMDKDTGLMDSDDVLGKVNVPLGPLEGSSSCSYNEAVPEGGVLTFSVTWEEGEAVTKKPKAASPAKTAAEMEEGKPETTQQL